MRKKTSFFDFLMLYDVAFRAWEGRAPIEDRGRYHGWGRSFDAADYMPICRVLNTKEAWKWLIDSTRVFTFCEIIHNPSRFAQHKDCFYALGDDYPQLSFVDPSVEESPFKTRAKISFRGRDANLGIIPAVTQASDEIKRLMTGRQGSKRYLRDDPETECLLNELRRDFFDTDISLARALGISKSTFEEVFQRQNRRMTIRMRKKIQDIIALKRREASSGMAEKK
ncbi:MAG: hypothetical protein LUC42_09150 [Akkermansia sp.]|uniref:hypothetical protein n=1 Tax=Akkermansia sp. TaxID=1872421 RepID=UPI00258692A0|nr:hypothetical protein [Akkermansia sp.]MCD8247804.1 hypothetical protein [Akkermansia sp.]